MRSFTRNFASLTKKEQKRFDALVEKAVQTHCCGMQIDILDIPKVFKAARAAFDAQQNVVEFIVAEYTKLSKGCGA